MKTNLVQLALAVSLIGATSLAQAQISTSPFDDTDGVVISERTVAVPVHISAENVKLSRAGYSMPMVKVLVPGLADVTVMDHRNENEGAPCMAAPTARIPEDIILGRPAQELVNMTIKLRRVSQREPAPTATDPNAETCQVYLVESINATIRTYPFTHERYSSVGTRNLADCR